MISATAYLATEQETIAFVNTQSKEADFEAKCKGVTLRSTAAVHIAFDRPADTSDFLLPADSVVDITDIEFTKISAIGNSGNGTLYIIGRR